MSKKIMIPEAKISNLLSPKLSDSKYSDFGKILDLLNDQKALKDYIPKNTGFYDRSFRPSDLYDSEHFFIKTFGEGFDILSYRTFPNAFCLQIMNKQGVPVFSGRTIGLITPINKVSLDTFLQIDTPYVPTKFETIDIAKDACYGSLGAYYYQIASIMMVQAQFVSWSNKEERGVPGLVINDYTELKTIPTFIALWGLYGYCQELINIVPTDAWRAKQKSRADAYKTWARGIVVDGLMKIAESKNPSTDVEVLLSTLRGIKLFSLYIDYVSTNNFNACRNIEQDIKSCFEGEKTVESITFKYGVDSLHTELM